MQNVLMIIFYALTFYAFLPGLISRTFGFRAFKRGRVKREVALTFDDGPDPRYTAQLLDLLMRYNAKATFFVVGAHADKHPELLRRMHDEGHVIGIHNYEHKTNWFMRPSTVKRHIAQTEEVIRQATGQGTVYYRPPWGIVNVFDYSLRNFQIILWSSLFGDWRFKLGANRLRKRLMKKLRPGEVLLLHDCGRTPGADDNAPANMLLALEPFLEEGTRRGFKFVGIDEMIALTDKARALVPSRSKRVMIGLWLAWEALFHKVFRTIPVGTPNPAFHYRMVKYNGRNLSLGADSSEELVKGDLIVELHFDNKLLLEMAHKSSSPIATAIRLIRAVDQRLPLLAKELQRNPAARGAKAVYGVTMIHRGADRLGFTVHSLPDGLFAKMSKLYLKVLMRVLTPSHKSSAKDKLASEAELAPHIVLFNMPELLAKADATGADGVPKQAGTNRASRQAGRQAERNKPSTLELNEEEIEGAAISKHGG